MKFKRNNVMKCNGVFFEQYDHVNIKYSQKGKTYSGVVSIIEIRPNTMCLFIGGKKGVIVKYIEITKFDMASVDAELYLKEI